jgi:hypothetical protein
MFSTHKQPEDTPTVRLMRAVKFDGNDLQANRAGMFTDAQQRVMRQRALWQLLSSVLSVVVPLFAIIYTYRPGDQMFFVIFLLFDFYILFGQYRIFQDYRHRTIKMMQGTVKLRRSKSQRYIEVSEHKLSFHVSRPIQKAFIEGEMYICYYTAISKALVAAEHIPSP